MFGLSKPSTFEGDPYGYLTNQLSHILLGGYLVTLYCYGFLFSSGEYPDQTLAFTLCSFTYLFVWEIGYQGWRGKDTVLDVVHVMLGGCVYLFVEMDWVIDKLFVWLTLCFTVTLVGASLHGRSR